MAVNGTPKELTVSEKVDKLTRTVKHRGKHINHPIMRQIFGEIVSSLDGLSNEVSSLEARVTWLEQERN